MKKARQGVVGLARASDIHYKREKKVDACQYSGLFALSTLLPTAHKANLLVPCRRSLAVCFAYNVYYVKYAVRILEWILD
jgi:hypothetical protein